MASAPTFTSRRDRVLWFGAALIHPALVVLACLVGLASASLDSPVVVALWLASPVLSALLTIVEARRRRAHRVLALAATSAGMTLALFMLLLLVAANVVGFEVYRNIQ